MVMLKNYLTAEVFSIRCGDFRKARETISRKGGQHRRNIQMPRCNQLGSSLKKIFDASINTNMVEVNRVGCVTDGYQSIFYFRRQAEFKSTI